MSKTQALKEFAAAVGLKLKVCRSELGQEFHLSKGGEPLVMEYDSNDMADSIEVYAGGHPGFKEAKAQYAYMIGEDL